MKNFEYIGKVVHEVAREGLNRERIPFRESVSEFFGGESKRERLAAVFSLLRNVMTNAAAKHLADKLSPNYDVSGLPFRFLNVETQEPLAQGYISEVFLLESLDDSPSFAVKVDYMHQGSADDLVSLAKEQRDEYEYMRKLYASLPGCVPEEWSLIVESPRTARPAIATVQEFLGTDLKDVFSDISESDLVNLLSSDQELFDVFEKFASITAALEDPSFLDFLGKKNLVIGSYEGKNRLYFLDPHFPRGWSDAQKNRLLGRVQYLKEIACMVHVHDNNAGTIDVKEQTTGADSRKE